MSHTLFKFKFISKNAYYILWHIVFSSQYSDCAYLGGGLNKPIGVGKHNSRAMHYGVE